MHSQRGRRFGRGDSGAIDLVLKRSTDSGATWSALQVVWSDGSNTCGNPCPVVDSRTGRILLPMTWNSGEDNGRELHRGTGTDTRRVFLTHSDDDGRSWSSAREITGRAKRPDLVVVRDWPGRSHPDPEWRARGKNRGTGEPLLGEGRIRCARHAFRRRRGELENEFGHRSSL